MADLNAMRAAAMQAAKASSEFLYRYTYVGGAQAISCRAPTEHTRGLTFVRSWDYAKARGCSMATARRELARLAEWEQLREERGQRPGGVRRWRVHERDADRIGREHIAALQAEGLSFDDERQVAA